MTSLVILEMSIFLVYVSGFLMDAQTWRRRQIKRIVTKLRRYLDGFRFIERPDGSFFIRDDENKYVGGIFMGLKPTSPIYSLIRTDNCHPFYRIVVRDVQQEIAPGTKMILRNES